MTLPDERTRAVIYAQNFLRDLLNPKATPRVPRAIRQRAGSVLRHFPHRYEMQMAAEKAPRIFGELADYDEIEGLLEWGEDKEKK